MIIGFDTNQKFIAWASVSIVNDNEMIIGNGVIEDDPLYFSQLSSLIMTSDLIAYESIQYYRNIKINSSTIQAIERIGHIQFAAMKYKKKLWSSTRPEVLKSLFGSSRVKKGPSKKLLSIRLGADIKKISQHCCDAAMVAIHNYYKMQHEAYLNRPELI